MTTDKTDPENIIRNYLLYLDNPNSLRDDVEVQRKTRAVLEATDPIDKLKALSELERAAKVDEEPIRAGFTEHARAWAGAEGVPISAFRELQVPDDVLREAGFDVPTSRRHRSHGRGSSEVSARQRAKAVPVDEIKGYALEREGTFVLADLQRSIGGSPATVRKAVDDLVGCLRSSCW